jgi:diguanylate cyclase (GGDEF)-like protein
MPVARPQTRPQLPKDRCTLTMLTGPTPGAIQSLSSAQGEIVLGRDESLPARIADRGISGEHARIVFVAGVFAIEDLDSTNGTYVNGARLTSSVQLFDGDRIQLGENTLIRVSLQDATEQEAAQRMYHAAVYDPLTQVFNRGHLDAMLVSEFAYAVRHSFPLSILFIDLDHFTEVNNAYGHQAGDAVLAATAAAIRSSVRIEDLVARYGGEELVVVARSIDSPGAQIIAERVRRKIEAGTVSFQGTAIRVTASVGVATHDPTTPYDNVAQLVAAADRAVYLAKAEGRNRVCTAMEKAPSSWRAPNY